MTAMCSACSEVITDGDKTATGPDGVIHYRCFKRGTAHGEEISLITLHQKLGALMRRVQELELRLTNDERDIPFRIGSSGL